MIKDASSAATTAPSTAMNAPLDNLWAPVPRDSGAHGPFDRRAEASSLELWLDIHRWSLGAAALCAAALAGAAAHSAAAQRGTPWRRLLA
ncbi:hypothetical protein [Sorangium sp. So ce1153]|uniref:hypothetical protein n=1 Tax=Sorangium sp. So ce1153 TaxID=3133333 RepID=UPI003F5EA0D0